MVAPTGIEPRRIKEHLEAFDVILTAVSGECRIYSPAPAIGNRQLVLEDQPHPKLNPTGGRRCLVERRWQRTSVVVVDGVVLPEGVQEAGER